MVRISEVVFMHTKVRHIYDNWVLHGARVGGGGERLIPAAVFLPMNCRTGNGEILPWRVVRTNSQSQSWKHYLL